MYRLVIKTVGGLVRKHYYFSEDDLESNAEMLLYSPNVLEVKGQKRKWFHWITIFNVS